MGLCNHVSLKEESCFKTLQGVTCCRKITVETMETGVVKLSLLVVLENSKCSFVLSKKSSMCYLNIKWISVVKST